MRIALIALLCLMCLPAQAFAQDIVELNKEGITAFKEGRFAEAAAKFKEAYSVDPKPPLKKNEAVAWFKAGNCDNALPAASEYLGLGVEDELSTKEAQAVVVRCRIEAAEKALAAGDTDAAESAIASAKGNAPTEEDQKSIASIEGDIQAQREADEKARQEALAAAEAEKEKQAAAAQRGQKQKQLVGLSVAGAGGAIIIGTLIYHIALATGTASKFKDAAAAGDRAEYDRLGKKLETGNWLVPTLYGVGLATAGLGVYVWWSAGGNESAPQQAGLGGFEELGVSATWRF